MGSIGEWIVGRMGGVTTSALSTRVSEAYADGYSDGEDEPVSGTTAKYGYRRAMSQGLRDFSKIDYQTILETVWTLWQSNPVADRAMEIKRDYIVGRGMAFTADDDDLQRIVDEFVEDNKLARRLREFTLQLFLFGSQCYPVFVRKTDGRVRLGYIDPAEIETVIAHPENAMEMWAVVVSERQDAAVWSSRVDKRVYRIIRKGETVVVSICAGCGAAISAGFDRCSYCGKALDGNEKRSVQATQYEDLLVTAVQAILEPWEHLMLAQYGLSAYSGSCHYEKVNSVSNQPRGYSDLLQQADWLDQHDETLFALADREQMAGYFSWDVTLEDADEPQVRARSQELRVKPPKKGSVNVHNGKETWAFNYPDLKQNATIETQKALLTNVLGGLGLPRHWYGYGDETNRATAQAQGDPTWRSLEHDQDVVREMVLGMLEFARDQAQIAGNWTPSKETSRDITATLPEMTSKDLAAVTTALSSLAMALSQAVQEGWITHETAAKAWAKVLAELDVEVDVAEELEKIAQEIEDSGGPEGKGSYFDHHGQLTGDEAPAGVDALTALFAGAAGAES